MRRSVRAYAAFFFVLFLAAHVVARITVPLADPYLLPLAALLAAVGLTEIYRLGPATVAPHQDPASPALHQGVWDVIGVAAFAGTLLYLQPPRAGRHQVL